MNFVRGFRLKGLQIIHFQATKLKTILCKGDLSRYPSLRSLRSICHCLCRQWRNFGIGCPWPHLHRVPLKMENTCSSREDARPFFIGTVYKRSAHRGHPIRAHKRNSYRLQNRLSYFTLRKKGSKMVLNLDLYSVLWWLRFRRFQYTNA